GFIRWEHGGKHSPGGALRSWTLCEPIGSLEQVADSCFRTLTTMDEEQVVRLEGNAASAIEGSKNISMKEIRGLGDRLSQLEQLSLEAKRIVKEQSDLAYAFLQNQQRALNLKDPSILPDLCDSHRQQLIVMSENYKRVVSIRDRCTNAKNELSSNLLTRLKWIVFIQNKIADAAQEIVINFESLRRLYKKLEVMEQLHLAPSMFLTTAVEVVRRKAFSNGYLKQTDELSHKFDKIYSEEIGLRHSFTSKLKKHFIYRMRPKSFDEELPDITLEDIEELRKKLPDLASYLQLPEEKALDHLLNRSLNNECFTEQDGRTQNSLQTMALRLPEGSLPLPAGSKNDIHPRPLILTPSQLRILPHHHLRIKAVVPPTKDKPSSDGSSLKTPPLLQSSTTTTSQPPLCRLRRELQDIREDADVLKGLREQILGQLGRVFEPMNADLTRLRSELEALSNKGDGELEDLRIEKEEELKVSVRKMVLEHELEMDNLKVELSNKQEKALIDAAVQSTETSDQQLSLKSEEITQLKSNLSDLEAQRDDLLAEKERIVSILESGFIQREKLSIKTREEELRALFDSELIEAKEALTQELEEGFASKAAAASEGFKANLARMEADKEASGGLAWRLRGNPGSRGRARRYKLKFKIMQASGAMERSPSASESELSMEVRQAIFSVDLY
ncbi:Putative LOC100876743, partial [Caligus rogercresseyi]